MSHDRPPCFVCERREAAVGQLLCSVCIAWAEVDARAARPEVLERDRVRRLFNRLEAAISHHKAAAGGFADTHDEALYVARDRVLRDYAEGKG